MYYKGINLAEGVNKSYRGTPAVVNSITIFISHIRIDKAAAIAIGNYIREAGFDIYLDINDQALQQAMSTGDPNKITQCIEKGLNLSTHLLCLVSESTVNSWWVPYEIGYGKKSNKDIATLRLKGTPSLPEYLKVTTILNGASSLNKYLSNLMKQNDILNESRMYKSINGENWGLSSTGPSHPLYPYLDQPS